MSQQQEVKGAQAYMDAVRERLDAIASRQLDAIGRAATAIVEAVEAGGLVYLFGTGHSHMLAEEGHYRAGGFAAVCPVLCSSLMLHEGAVSSTQLERVSKLGPAVLGRYRPTPKDVLVIFSNSGVNAVPVETALAAKEIGMKVIAVVAQAMLRRFPQGRRVRNWTEICRYRVGQPRRSRGCAGGAGRSSGVRVGPLSTIAGAFLLNAVLTEVAWRMNEQGITPPVYISANMPGAGNIMPLWLSNTVLATAISEIGNTRISLSGAQTFDCQESLWRRLVMRSKLFKIVVLFVIALMILPQMPAAARAKVEVTVWHMEQPPYRVERIQTADRRVQRRQPRHRRQAGAAELGRDLHQGARRDRRRQRARNAVRHPGLHPHPQGPGHGPAGGRLRHRAGRRAQVLPGGRRALQL